ncbi:hypothetical protein MNBD_ALPHA07-1299, partial [hydrothermal vent metagenome]
MIRHFITCLFIAVTTTQASAQATAQSSVPPRHQVVTEGIDFFGADLEPLFDTTRQACQVLCLGNPECKAFTYNSRTNACFPKSEVSEKTEYAGAISAEILPTDPRVLEIADMRRKDLTFLSDSDLSKAYTQAVNIGAAHPAGQWEVQAMLDAARAKTGEGDFLNAMRWTGGAISVLDTSDLWADYARLSLRIRTNGSDVKQRDVRRALLASTNAYLRALTDGARVS